MADTDYEQAVWRKHHFLAVAGLDEAGRGALAGPVFAGAAILPFAEAVKLEPLTAVNDSKQLTAKQRQLFFDLIVTHAVTYGIGQASALEIDQMGIIGATKTAMLRALAQCEPTADYLLIDGRIRLPQTGLRQQSIIRGDSKSLSIAAASILAKVARDRHMIALATEYPQYEFERHKGYCTRRHEALLKVYGASVVHRHTFAPIRQPML